MSFWVGFEKTATSKWQRMWKTLSPGAKQRMRRYSGSGVKDVRKMREGMFTPKYDSKVVKRREKIDKKVFQQALKKDPDIRVTHSKAMPYAVKEPGQKGHIMMPKDPTKGTQTMATKTKSLAGAKGTHSRSMLEHEKAELKLERLKAKRNKAGKKARKNIKAIQESGDVTHSGAMPLAAEANIAGRNPKTMKDLKSAWGESKAQGQMFKKLKEVGWTPASGIPLGGRQGKAFQRSAEKAFGPQYQKYVGRRMGALKRQFRGKQLKTEQKALMRETGEFAGGKGAKRKFRG